MYSKPSEICYPTIGRIRKIPFTNQRQSFRSRLQRSAEGNTTEEESSLQENGFFGNHHNDIANLAEDCNIIALQCTADLDIRTKLIQKALDNSNSWITTIRSDLEDIRSRLAVVETAIEIIAKEGKNSTTEDNTTRRTLRSQQ
ncbi:hypothetical protein PROQFM164_S02g002740 [Penicillium roqueforti FM164]|uniref:Uncharacterized protein n=1 Tax=Penicillium roqueforti (strain FM164) TaxID=1365484 RepID=W6QEF8_PENRF|nr:hypothetical protein PROQFM164_S02g002740 [Penicillium roqueforti FM164]